MTRKKAIEIVVANVKMGWPHKKWQLVAIETKKIRFYTFSAILQPPYHGVDGWNISRKWLEEKGHL